MRERRHRSRLLRSHPWSMRASGSLVTQWRHHSMPTYTPHLTGSLHLVCRFSRISRSAHQSAKGRKCDHWQEPTTRDGMHAIRCKGWSTTSGGPVWHRQAVHRDGRRDRSPHRRHRRGYARAQTPGYDEGPSTTAVIDSPWLSTAPLGAGLRCLATSQTCARQCVNSGHRTPPFRWMCQDIGDRY